MHGILINSVILLGLDFMPPDKISNIFLNDLRRKVVTHDKTLIKPHMDELSYSLDSEHQVTSKGTPLSFYFP
jgi:hypothetical protein